MQEVNASFILIKETRSSYPSLMNSEKNLTKSELDKSVDLSLCGLAPAQSQKDLFLGTLCVRNKQRATNFNQSEEAMSHA